MLSDSFDLTVVRYIRLTVTGAATYDGPWCSISDLEIICAGTSLSVTENDMFSTISVYPNPFAQTLTINIPLEIKSQVHTIRLVNLLGEVVINKIHSEGKITNMDVSNSLSKGIYFLQFLGETHNVLGSKKVIKKN